MFISEDLTEVSTENNHKNHKNHKNHNDTNSESLLGEKEQASSRGMGLLAMEKEKLNLIPPDDEECWPKIKPGKNVVVKVKGQEIRDYTVVTDLSEVEIRAEEQPPQSNFYLNFSSDLYYFRDAKIYPIWNRKRIKNFLMDSSVLHISSNDDIEVSWISAKSKYKAVTDALKEDECFLIRWVG